jgi:hypothetical protein
MDVWNLNVETEQRGEKDRERYIDESIIEGGKAIINREKTMDFLESLPEAMELREVFEFMDIVFPVTTSTTTGGSPTNPILLPSSSCYFNPPAGKT